jgi:hypothetical protein
MLLLEQAGERHAGRNRILMMSRVDGSPASAGKRPSRASLRVEPGISRLGGEESSAMLSKDNNIYSCY